MLRVGINENVRLNAAETKINDKGSLVLNFVQGKELSQVDTDDLFNNNAGVRSGNGTNIMLFPVDVESNGEKREVDRISKDFVGLRDQLEHILQGYMTTDKAKLNPYEGVSLTKDNFATEIVKPAVAERIYKNLTSQFVAKVNALTEEDLAKEFRLLLLRRSEAKHYGTLRKNFITDHPFWESMSIPKEGSQVHFTKYEIGKGLNNPDPVNKAAAADQTEGATATTADDILGSR